MKILVLNCGSSSLKYQLIDMANEKVMAKGAIERIGLKINGGEENVIVDFKYSGLSDEKLAEKYARQLKTYKIAVMQAYDVKVDKILLYSFKTGHFIDIK